MRLRRGPRPPADLVTIPEEDRAWLAALHDPATPLPEGAEAYLREDNPRLAEWRAAHGAGMTPSRWSGRAVQGFLDLRFFRGETLFMWHYRELPRISALKYFVWLRHVEERDAAKLLARLDEDGAFGCWTWEYPGRPRVSRDLLESVLELGFLTRTAGLGDGSAVLDIGAGYGRLAHRAATAFPRLRDWCCVDAVPEASFLCEYYLRHRGCAPPARVVAPAQLAEIPPGAFDVAVNVHSFSECTLEAIGWWVAQLERLGVPRLLVVPNEPEELLSLEADGSRRDFAPVLARAGYALEHVEPVVDDPAVRELLRLEDRFHLFAR